MGWTAWAELSVSKALLELEPVVGDTFADFSFPFKNTGPQTIQIVEIVSSCGCTTAELEQRSYQPGESGELKGRFVFEGRTGFQHKKITLKTNDPQQPLIQLSIHLEIPQLVSVTPQFVYWQLGGELEEKIITLKLNEQVQASAPQLNYMESLWQVQVHTILPGQTYQVRIKPIDLEKKVISPIEISLTWTTHSGEKVKHTQKLKAYAAIK